MSGLFAAAAVLLSTAWPTEALAAEGPALDNVPQVAEAKLRTAWGKPVLLASHSSSSSKADVILTLAHAQSGGLTRMDVSEIIVYRIQILPFDQACHVDT